MESWGDLFCCFVNPAARMQLGKLGWGIQFEMEAGADKAVDPNDPTSKAMREAAQHLGLNVDVDK